MSEETSFIMGIAGIAASIFMTMIGWMPLWVMFGSIIFAASLYGTKFFATGIIGGFASGAFASFGWLPLWMYFTPLVLGALFVGVRMANKYVNIGVD